MKVEQVAKVEPKPVAPVSTTVAEVVPVPAHVAAREAKVLKEIEHAQNVLKLAKENKKMKPEQLKVIEANTAAVVKEFKHELEFIARFKKDQSPEAVKHRVKELKAELNFLRTVE